MFELTHGGVGVRGGGMYAHLIFTLKQLLSDIQTIWISGRASRQRYYGVSSAGVLDLSK